MSGLDARARRFTCCGPWGGWAPKRAKAGAVHQANGGPSSPLRRRAGLRRRTRPAATLTTWRAAPEGRASASPSSLRQAPPTCSWSRPRAPGPPRPAACSCACRPWRGRRPRRPRRRARPTRHPLRAATRTLGRSPACPSPVPSLPRSLARPPPPATPSLVSLRRGLWWWCQQRAAECQAAVGARQGGTDAGLCVCLAEAVWLCMPGSLRKLLPHCRAPAPCSHLLQPG